MYHAEGDLRTRTFEYGRRIVRLYGALPRSTVSQVFGNQLLRSGTAVGANYREAQRGRSRAELFAKIGDCLRETDESLYWLEHIQEEKLLTKARLRAIIQESNELIAIFVAILRDGRK